MTVFGHSLSVNLPGLPNNISFLSRAACEAAAQKYRAQLAGTAFETRCVGPFVEAPGG
jgi:hypothetical protein